MKPRLCYCHGWNIYPAPCPTPIRCRLICPALSWLGRQLINLSIAVARTTHKREVKP